MHYRTRQVKVMAIIKDARVDVTKTEKVKLFLKNCLTNTTAVKQNTLSLSLLCRHGWAVRVSLVSIRRSLIDQQPKSIHPFVPFVRFELMVHGVRWLWT